MKKKKASGFTLRSSLGLDVQQLTQMLSAQPVVHFNCNGSIAVENCKSICLYSETHIMLDMGKQFLTIKGEDLLMRTLTKHYLTISGRNFSITCSEKGG